MMIPHRPHTDAAKAVLAGIAGQPALLAETASAPGAAQQALATIPQLPIAQPWIDPRAIAAMSMRARRGLGDATGEFTTGTWIAIGLGALVLFGGIALLASSNERDVQRARNARSLERGDLRYLDLDDDDDFDDAEVA